MKKSPRFVTLDFSNIMSAYILLENKTMWSKDTWIKNEHPTTGHLGRILVGFHTPSFISERFCIFQKLFLMSINVIKL